MIIGEIITRNAKRYPDKKAVVCDGSAFTFKEFNERVNNISNALTDLGIQKGERVAAFLDNCHQYVELYCAAPKSGFVLVPLNYMLSGKELAFILDNSGAKAIFVSERYVQTIQSIQDDLGGVKNFITVGTPTDGMMDYEQLISQYPPDEPNVKIDENDLVYLLYTSGTTGLPKGVVHSQRSLIEIIIQYVILPSLRRDDVGLVTIPLYWGPSPLLHILPHFYVGSTLVVLRQSSPEMILESVQAENVTMTLMPPSSIISILNHPHLNDYNISSLRSIIFGGEPMPVEVLKKAIEVFGKIFSHVYGLMEITPVTYFSEDDFVLDGPPHVLKRLQSCGKEALNVEVRVVDENDVDVSPGKVGEVIARGDNMMKGYWELPQATAETIRGGYVRTGDLATIDEEGYIFLVGRKKDIITASEKTIYPADVEEVLYRYPSVSQAAVIGVPDEKAGESVTAVVVLNDKAEATEEDIIKFCKENLASYAVPKSIEFVEELPRNPSGKILKRKLRDIYGKGTS
ncbi:MAG: long-chain-fatty-acid--CoA ligase [Thermodesulfobacteriota bacterium]|nr:long-chain-fatty-acid--CoA ligase [Thermodesulfobacteriota bacterium]